MDNNNTVNFSIDNNELNLESEHKPEQEKEKKLKRKLSKHQKAKAQVNAAKRVNSLLKNW